MRIVGLDVATTIGIAVGDVGGIPKSWGLCLGEKKYENVLFSKALILTHKLITEYEPDLIAYEAAVGGDKTSHFLVGLVACIKGCASNRGVDTGKCNIGAIRKHFIGKHITSASFPDLPKSKRKAHARSVAKAAVQSRCKQLGWGDLSEDAADACAVWDYACGQVRGRSSIPGEMFN